MHVFGGGGGGVRPDTQAPPVAHCTDTGGSLEGLRGARQAEQMTGRSPVCRVDRVCGLCVWGGGGGGACGGGGRGVRRRTDTDVCGSVVPRCVVRCCVVWVKPQAVRRDVLGGEGGGV